MNDRHDEAACDDPTCEYCAAYGHGYADGKDAAHEELSGGRASVSAIVTPG